MPATIQPYIMLGLAALLTVAAAFVMHGIEKLRSLRNVNPWAFQIFAGIVFGLIAVVGTEWGIPLETAQINARDAAVVTAGLMFGGPAGIIAGTIGGLERWFAVYWGIGSYTRIACSVSTFLAGVFSAFARKYLFEHKRPGWLISLATGVVVEVFHLAMVFLTNIDTPTKAMGVVQICTIPMVVANSVAVMLSSLVLAYMDRKYREEKGKAAISRVIQRYLLIAVIVTFVFTTVFVFSMQNTLAVRQTESMLELSSKGVSADIMDASDENILKKARKIAQAIDTLTPKAIATRYEVDEVNIVNKNGVIVASNNDKFIGFNMDSGEQAREFLVLLGDQEEYVQSYGPISYDPSSYRKYVGIKLTNGFVQVGYDSERFQHDLQEEVDGITKHRAVGNTGYILIFNENCDIVSSPTDFDNTSFDASILRKNPSEVTFDFSLGEEKAFGYYVSTEGYYILSVLPETEAMQFRNVALYVNTFMEVLVFGILFVMVYMLIRGVVVNKLQTVNQSLAKITAGDLDEVVSVRSTQEFCTLSNDLNSTVATLKNYITEAEARIDRELVFAKNIQSSALPSTFPAFPKRKDFDIFATMDTAKEVGGDFYDFYIIDENILHFLIADVSGKGIPAAMFMMRAKTELKSLTESGLPICDVFTKGNVALCEGNDAGMFVTAWQGGIDLTKGTVQFVNAGHNPPVVCHKGHSFEYLKSRPGLVLAGMDGLKYRTQELQLRAGDIVFLYTDGVTEAQNAAEELYGEDRLLESLNAVPEYQSMEELCRHVKQGVDAFVGDAPQFDDITMVAFRYLGEPPAPKISFERATLADIPAITEFVRKQLMELHIPEEEQSKFFVAIDEIYSNIVHFSYPDGEGPASVTFRVREDTRMIYLRFEDSGAPYNPLVKDDPDADLGLNNRIEGGLSIFVAKNMMDDMKYKYENKKNILTVVKSY